METEFLLSLAKILFESSFGLIWKSERQRQLKKLEEGGQPSKYQEMLLTELDDLHVKINQQSRTRLKLCLREYKGGLEQLRAVFKEDDHHLPRTRSLTRREAFNLKKSFKAKPLHADMRLDEARKNLKLEKKRDSLEEAKRNFEEACKNAAEAFENEGLSAFDRVTGQSIYILAKLHQKILENVLHNVHSLELERISTAFISCKTSLEQLHAMTEVTKVFKNAITKKAGKLSSEQAQIFVGVCSINFVIHDIVERAFMDRGLWRLPGIDIENHEEKIDALRDARVTEIMARLGVGHLCVTSSLEEENVEERKLVSPLDIAANGEGHLIIADDGDRTIKVFERSGKSSFEFKFSFQALSRRVVDEHIISVATDKKDNFFVLIQMDKYRFSVYVFDKQGTFSQKFKLSKGLCSTIAINDNGEILVAKEVAVELYQIDGTFIRSFERDVLTKVEDIAVLDDGYVIVLNNDGHVCVFNQQGCHLPNYELEVIPSAKSIIFFHKTQHFATLNYETQSDFLSISIYSINNEKAEYVKSIYQPYKRTSKTEKELQVTPKMTVTKEGRIVILTMIGIESKVIVL
ncbi:uncharacterized protein [Montipora capricornis]|uniref:uncharacterized protein n=1 Tax=Montipora capricornis TaxID=246305 RepID=UPI0035F0FF1C